MIFTILNYSHGLDLFLMLETGPRVENFHGNVRDQRDVSFLLPPLLQRYRIYKPFVGTAEKRGGQTPHESTNHCSFHVLGCKGKGAYLPSPSDFQASRWTQDWQHRQSQSVWVRILALSLIICVTLGESHHLAVP